jgi:predicted kinase
MVDEDSETGMPAPVPAGATKPLVVALIGLPGAGKSVVARYLRDRFGLRRVCRDDIRAAMFPDCSYTPMEKRAAFRTVLTAIEINCVMGFSTVLDGMTLARRSEREKLRATAEACGARYLQLWLRVPPDAARERVKFDLATGAHSARDRTPAIVEEVIGRFQIPTDDVAVIDASAPAEHVCALAGSIVEAEL